MPNIILGDDIVERFRQVYDQTSALAWAAGDFLVDVIDEIAPTFGNERQDFHLARAGIVRQLANKVGCDTTTLYDREGMSRFYPEIIRREYSAFDLPPTESL